MMNKEKSLKRKKRHNKDLYLTRKRTDLTQLPLGTRFYVKNGAWYGRVAGTAEEKTIFVEYTGRTHPLTADHGLEIEIAEER